MTQAYGSWFNVEPSLNFASPQFGFEVGPPQDLH